MRYLSECLWTHSLDVDTIVPNISHFLTWNSNISVLSGWNLLHLYTIVSLVGHLLRPLVLFKYMTHSQFKRTFRFSKEGVRYCHSEGQAELDFYSVLRAPAQHQPSRALSRKVSKIFWAVLSCFSALMNLISQSLLNWGNCIKDHWPYPNQDRDAKPQSGTYSLHQSPKSGH